jgi:hypothetical protein
MDQLTQYSPDRPLLLVTDYPLDLGGGGAVILRSLLGATDRAGLIWACPSLRPDSPPGLGGGQVLLQGSHRFGRLLRRRSLTVDALSAGRLANEISEIARQQNAAALWIVMHGAVVHVAARLLKQSVLPTHLSVHDDPPFGVALVSRRHLAMVPFIEHDFSSSLRRARSIDVISQGMLERYRRRYGVTATVVHRGMAGPIAPSPSHAPSGVLEVGVLGNTYGYRQVVLLADAIVRAAATLGVRGRVVIIGQGHGARLRDQMGGRLEVEVTGHLDEGVAVERLQRCFLLYLNYPFSWRAAVLRQTSFPTKLSTYLLAARPLLAHAPADSSIAPLFNGHAEYVNLWRNERAEDGEAAICRAWNDGASHASQHVPAERLRSHYYDLETNRDLLFRALNGLVRDRGSS